MTSLLFKVLTIGLLFKAVFTKEDDDPSLVYTAYDTSPYCTPSSAFVFPKITEELQGLVRTAIWKGQKIKAIGHLHSATDIICTDGIPVSMVNFNKAVVNNDGTATFGAGLPLGDAMEFLQARNLSLIHIPSFLLITIGGAIGTGAHGSSLKHAASLSDQVVRVKFVDGKGNVRIVDNKFDLQAVRLHLGLLGLVTEVTFTTVPLVKMTATRTVQPESILNDGTLIRIAEENDFVQAGWFPSKGFLVLTKGNYVDVSTKGNAYNNLYQDYPAATIKGLRDAYDIIQEQRNIAGFFAIEENTAISFYNRTLGGGKPIFTEDGVNIANPATGYPWHLMGAKCSNLCTWENGAESMLYDDASLGFPTSELAPFVATVKKVVSEFPAAFPFAGLVFRFHKSSDALMGIAHGGPTVVISVLTPRRSDPFTKPRTGMAAYQAILQAAFFKHQGRVHWGKNGAFYLNKEALTQSIPPADRLTFLAAMFKYDPFGVFMNKFGRRLQGISNDEDRDPKVVHCALNDACVCQNNFDCADGQECTTLPSYPEYPVCKDLGPPRENPPLGHYDPYNLTSIFIAILNPQAA